MHFHDWQPLDHYTDVPTQARSAQERTNFLILACACGAATVFPLENYLSSLPEFQRDLNDVLTRAGLTLDLSV